METTNNMLIDFMQQWHKQKQKRYKERIESMKAQGGWDRFGRYKIKISENFDEVVKR